MKLKKHDIVCFEWINGDFFVGYVNYQSISGELAVTVYEQETPYPHQSIYLVKEHKLTKIGTMPKEWR